MKPSELRAKSDTELGRDLLDLRREQFNLRMQRGAGQLADPMRFNAVRKDIARIKTIQTERAGGNAPVAGAVDKAVKKAVKAKVKDEAKDKAKAKTEAKTKAKTKTKAKAKTKTKAKTGSEK